MSQLHGTQAAILVDGNAPVCNDPPAYEISAADWLTLVEKLGLASYLEDTAK
ncbi:hypothetical protein [Mycobacterium sp.]|jgi:hypothetical protein|uniref:hypothetical protein n=1 Tax=Mycobacterium sp. TaxID=1785 RepID=UPI003F9512A4